MVPFIAIALLKYSIWSILKHEKVVDLVSIRPIGPFHLH
jgi:hypothetical protein